VDTTTVSLLVLDMVVASVVVALAGDRGSAPYVRATASGVDGAWRGRRAWSLGGLRGLPRRRRGQPAYRWWRRSCSTLRARQSLVARDRVGVHGGRRLSRRHGYLAPFHSTIPGFRGRHE